MGIIFLCFSCKEEPTEPDDAGVEPPYKGKIIFSSNRGGDGLQLFTMNPDGTDIQQLTFGGYNKYSPRWSPDKKQIAFVSDSLGTTAGSPIWLMNSEGSNIEPLKWEEGKQFPLYGNWPAWSPDGKKIAFSYCNCEASTNSEIYVIDLKTKEVKQLTNNSAWDDYPDWSPDGSKIVFMSDRDYDRIYASELYVMNADGSDQKRLTFTDSSRLEHPAWSPESDLIVFRSNLDKKGTGIFTLTLNNNIIRRVSSLTSGAVPRWSPNGTKIVFVAFAVDSSMNTAIWIVSLKDSILIKLTDGSGIDRDPDWAK